MPTFNFTGVVTQQALVLWSETAADRRFAVHLSKETIADRRTSPSFVLMDITGAQAANFPMGAAVSVSVTV